MRVVESNFYFLAIPRDIFVFCEIIYTQYRLKKLQNNYHDETTCKNAVR